MVNQTHGAKAFVSWSGGKDAYLSLLLAEEKGLEVNCLLNFMGKDGHSRSHGLSGEVLEHQARFLGVPLEKKEVARGSYQEGFLKAAQSFKKQGITGGVFGDINLKEHRAWIEEMCGLAKINYYLPLWGMKEREVSEELLRRGGCALLVSIKSDLVEEKWLGEFLGEAFLDYCENRGLSPCGERGEFHTLVVDGPRFSYPLNYTIEGIEKANNHALLRISCL